MSLGLRSGPRRRFLTSRLLQGVLSAWRRNSGLTTQPIVSFAHSEDVAVLICDGRCDTEHKSVDLDAAPNIGNLDLCVQRRPARLRAIGYVEALFFVFICIISLCVPLRSQHGHPKYVSTAPPAPHFESLTLDFSQHVRSKTPLKPDT